MRKNRITATLVNCFALCAVLGTAQMTLAQAPATKYTKMATLDQYLMADQAAEIALARTAAPKSISADAEVWVLKSHGYETAVKGKNGFVCIVGRGWAAAADPDYWNPRVRVPMCVNAPGARTYLLRVTKITNLALSGQTIDQVNQAIAAALAKKELPPMEAGSMCYMTGKQGYGGDVAPHWPAHLMFFYSDTDPAIWGANQPGSPVIAVADPLEHLTQFVIEAKQWSDGTPATSPNSPNHHHATAPTNKQ